MKGSCNGLSTDHVLMEKERCQWVEQPRGHWLRELREACSGQRRGAQPSREPMRTSGAQPWESRLPRRLSHLGVTRRARFGSAKRLGGRCSGEGPSSSRIGSENRISRNGLRIRSQGLPSRSVPALLDAKECPERTRRPREGKRALRCGSGIRAQTVTFGHLAVGPLHQHRRADVAAVSRLPRAAQCALFPSLMRSFVRSPDRSIVRSLVRSLVRSNLFCPSFVCSPLFASVQLQACKKTRRTAM